MKKEFSLKVNKPCTEDWNQFKPTARGGFCSSCNKEVIDFTKMTEGEIIHFFNSKSSKTCGRFKPQQLKTYATIPKENAHRGFSWLHTGIMGLSLLLMGRPGSAKSVPVTSNQEWVQLKNVEHKKDTLATSKHIIKGVVTDNDKVPLPGVNVLLKGTKVGTITNIAGVFQFPVELEAGAVLVFSHIGFESKEYVVPKNAPAVIEIPMMMQYFELMGEVAFDDVYQLQPGRSGNWWQRFKDLF